MRAIRAGRFGVYFVKCGDFIKIGRTGRRAKRLQALATAAPFPLEGLGWMPCGPSELASLCLEKALHEKWAALRVKGEWFRDTPELRAYIQKHTKPWDALVREVMSA